MKYLTIQILVYFLFLGENIFGKNYFDADVLNNRFKVRRLITFKLDLCRAIYEVNPQNSDELETYA